MRSAPTGTMVAKSGQSSNQVEPLRLRDFSMQQKGGEWFFEFILANARTLMPDHRDDACSAATTTNVQPPRSSCPTSIANTLALAAPFKLLPASEDCKNRSIR